MTTQTDHSQSYTGQGEFALRNARVRAEVQVRDGIIEVVKFSSSSADVSSLVSEVTPLLLGKSVSKALEFTCDDLHECADREKKSALSVMLEAFYRALEEWLD